MTTLTEFTDSINEYTSSHRREGLGGYHISGLYDLFPQAGEPPAPVEYKWPDDWPNPDNAGIYAFFDEQANLIRIGKTSMNSFLAARLAAHFGYTPERGCRIKKDWAIAPRFVMTVAVPDDATWEASALEEFTIKRLNPPLNRNGRSS